jgi:hypothetical protein
MTEETPKEPFNEVLTSLINFNIGRNPENLALLDDFHSILFYAEQMPKLSGQSYHDAFNNFNYFKLRLISKISQL